MRPPRLGVGLSPGVVNAFQKADDVGNGSLHIRRYGQNDLAIAMNRRNALFAGHDEGGRNWARFASLIGTCKMNGVEPYAYLCDLFTRLANGHLVKDIDALMPWTYAARIKASQ